MKLHIPSHTIALMNKCHLRPVRKGIIHLWGDFLSLAHLGVVFGVDSQTSREKKKKPRISEDKKGKITFTFSQNFRVPRPCLKIMTPFQTRKKKSLHTRTQHASVKVILYKIVLKIKIKNTIFVTSPFPSLPIRTGLSTWAEGSSESAFLVQKANDSSSRSASIHTLAIRQPEDEISVGFKI